MASICHFLLSEAAPQTHGSSLAFVQRKFQPSSLQRVSVNWSIQYVTWCRLFYRETRKSTELTQPQVLFFIQLTWHRRTDFFCASGFPHSFVPHGRFSLFTCCCQTSRSDYRLYLKTLKTYIICSGQQGTREDCVYCTEIKVCCYVFSSPKNKERMYLTVC